MWSWWWMLGLAMAGPLDRAPASFGSASFVGLDPGEHEVHVGGEAVPFVPELDAFVLPATRARTYRVGFLWRGHVVLHGDFTVRSGRHQACALMPSRGGLAFHATCRDKEGVLELAEVRGSTAYGGDGGLVVDPDLVAVEGAPTPRTPMPLPGARGVIDDESLDSLVDAVESATFGPDQVEVVQGAAGHNKFTCAQVLQLLEPIASGRHKLQAVEALRPAIVDPGNAHLLEQAFTFSSDKQQLRALFR